MKAHHMGLLSVSRGPTTGVSPYCSCGWVRPLMMTNLTGASEAWKEHVSHVVEYQPKIDSSKLLTNDEMVRYLIKRGVLKPTGERPPAFDRFDAEYDHRTRYSTTWMEKVDD